MAASQIVAAPHNNVAKEDSNLFAEVVKTAEETTENESMVTATNTSLTTTTSSSEAATPSWDFVDSFCASSSEKSACSDCNPTTSAASLSCSLPKTTADSFALQKRSQFHADFMQWLGCAHMTFEEEQELILKEKPGPKRISMAQRYLRLQKWQAQDLKGSLRHGWNRMMAGRGGKRSNTFNDRKKLRRHQVSLTDEGYDSDPEVPFRRISLVDIEDDAASPRGERASHKTSESPTSSTWIQEQNSRNDEGRDAEEDPQEDITRDPLVLLKASSEENKIIQSVQESLNRTWTVVWHPNSKNLQEHGLLSTKPLTINIWLERGSVLPDSGLVVEPHISWRDVDQLDLAKSHRLNDSSTTPWKMRLLNTCRLNPCTSLDRGLYPLARQHSSFVWKTCDGREYLMECKSPDDRLDLLTRWKMAIARFASLAVIEDVDTIAKEFFVEGGVTTPVTVGTSPV